MTKPTLFWTLKPKWWSGGFEVMRVTTAKPKRFYGSTIAGEATHVVAKDCKGRFDTQEAAEAVVSKIERVKAAHADNHAFLTAARNRAEAAERAAIEQVLNGMEPDAPPSPPVLLQGAMAQGASRCRQLVRYGNG